LDGAKIGVSGIQQYVPFPPDCRRWNQQGRTFSVANPPISEPAQRLVPGFVPADWKSSYVEPVNLDRIGDGAFDRHEIRRSQIRLQIDEGFNRGERQRTGGVDHANTRAVPSAAKETSALASRSLIGIEPTADPPELH
jgi:hypothetical protein